MAYRGNQRVQKVMVQPIVSFMTLRLFQISYSNQSSSFFLFHSIRFVELDFPLPAKRKYEKRYFILFFSTQRCFEIRIRFRKPKCKYGSMNK